MTPTKLTSTCLLQSFNPPWVIEKSLLQTVQRAAVSFFLLLLFMGTL